MYGGGDLAASVLKVPREFAFFFLALQQYSLPQLHRGIYPSRGMYFVFLLTGYFVFLSLLSIQQQLFKRRACIRVFQSFERTSLICIHVLVLFAPTAASRFFCFWSFVRLRGDRLKRS